MAAQVWESKTYPSSCEAAWLGWGPKNRRKSPVQLARGKIFSSTTVEFRHPLHNRMKLHKTLQSHKLLTTLGFVKAVWAQTLLLVPGSAVTVVVVVCAKRGWLFIHLKIRKDFLCAAKLEPTNRQATVFLLVLARAFIGGYYFNIGFRKWVFPPNLSPILPDFNLSPTCRKLRFLWLVAPFFALVVSRLERAWKLWARHDLKLVDFNFDQISQDLPAFAIIWAPSPSSIQFPLFHSSSPQNVGVDDGDLEFLYNKAWSMAFWLGTPLLVVFVSVTSFFWMG